MRRGEQRLDQARLRVEPDPVADRRAGRPRARGGWLRSRGARPLSSTRSYAPRCWIATRAGASPAARCSANAASQPSSQPSRCRGVSVTGSVNQSSLVNVIGVRAARPSPACVQEQVRRAAARGSRDAWTAFISAPPPRRRLDSPLCGRAAISASPATFGGVRRGALAVFVLALAACGGPSHTTVADCLNDAGFLVSGSGTEVRGTSPGGVGFTLRLYAEPCRREAGGGAARAGDDGCCRERRRRLAGQPVAFGPSHARRDPHRRAVRHPGDQVSRGTLRPPAAR